MIEHYEKTFSFDVAVEAHRSVLENHPDAVFFVDKYGYYRGANPATPELLGYDREDFSHRMFGDFAIEEDRPRVREHLKTALRGTAQEFEFVGAHKSGRNVHIQCTIVPSVIDGEIIGVYGFSKDISQRVYAQEQLKRSQTAFEHAQTIAKFGTWQYDLATQTLHWSDALRRLHGVPFDYTPTPNSYYDLIHPEDRVHLHETVEERVTSHVGKPSEYRIIRPLDGTVRTVLSHWSLLNDDEGRPRQYFGTVQDITERKVVEESLAQAQAMARVGNYAWDRAADEVTGSAELFRIYGMDGRTTVSIEEILNLVHPNDRDRLMKETYSAIRQANVIHDVQCRLILGDGTERDVHIHGQALFDDDGQPATVVGTVQDITERRQTEEYLRKSDKLAVVGQLAAGVAHEIRNPLTTLKGFVQLLQTSSLPIDKRKQFYDIMMQELNHIEFIASEMLVLAKPQVMSLQERNIVDLLNDVVHLLLAQALLDNVELRLHAHHQPIFVVCEETQMKQVFVNIIKNAIEAMPNGGEVDIAVFHEEGDDEVAIRFTDNGCGIAPDRIPKLAEPFYTTKERGTGLGLMISHKIIQSHKGDLAIHSELGHGTTVVISLPIVACDE